MHTTLSALQQFIDQQHPASLLQMTKKIMPMSKPMDALDEMASHGGKSFAYKSLAIIHAMRHAGMLRSGDKMRQAVTMAIEQTLPPALLAPVKQFMDRIAIPHKSSLSRWQFLLGVAMMQTERARRMRDYVTGEKWARWLMVDSSPQGGRDYELAITCAARHSDLEKAMQLADGLQNFSRTTPTEEDLTMEVCMMDELRSLFRVHKPPPAVLGSGRCTVSHKFTALLHSLFLEVGQAEGCKVFQHFVNEFCIQTTDFGAEYGIALIRPVPIMEVFPWLRPPAPGIIGFQEAEEEAAGS